MLLRSDLRPVRFSLTRFLTLARLLGGKKVQSPSLSFSAVSLVHILVLWFSLIHQQACSFSLLFKERSSLHFKQLYVCVCASVCVCMHLMAIIVIIARVQAHTYKEAACNVIIMEIFLSSSHSHCFSGSRTFNSPTLPVRTCLLSSEFSFSLFPKIEV